MPHNGKIKVMSFGLSGNGGDGVYRKGNGFSTSRQPL
jgi:hypothetical protein